MENYKNSKIGQETAQKYGDIIEMERPQTEESLRKHPRMTLQNRAKIFSPFAALRGYDEQLAAQQDRLDALTLKVSDMETLLEDISAAAYDKAVEVVTDVVRTETRKEDMRMIEDTKKWVLSPERKAPKATREYASHRLDDVLNKFLKTMQTTAARLQEKLLKPEVRQKGKEQVKEKARDSVLQLLNRLQAEQAQRVPGEQHTAEKSETRGDVY